MYEELEIAIADIVDYAIRNEKVFVFGDSVFNPDEAKWVMLENAENDIVENDWTLERYIKEMKNCLEDEE